MQHVFANVLTIAWEGLDILKMKRHHVAPI